MGDVLGLCLVELTKNLKIEYSEIKIKLY